MEKNILKLFLTVLMGFLVVASGAQNGIPSASVSEAVDLDAELRAGEYRQKVEAFMVILDASSTMSQEGKFEMAKGVAGRMNQTIPDMPLVGALRTLGENRTNETRLVYGPTRYQKGGFESAIAGVRGFGSTPLGKAIEAATGDLRTTPGKTAVIILSDGKATDKGALMAAEAMKEQLGDRLCIYTVLLGDDPAGARLMEQIAGAGKCGFSTAAESISSQEGMTDFVERVFLEKAEKVAKAVVVDSDGDGVSDDRDECPNTPAGVTVDSRGCPLDSDGDGVPDYLDQCPGTPAGVSVDSRGCPPDTDGDGVPDYRDQCPGTPAGVAVDDTGCPPDTDGDGVVDHLDQCPDTPEGATVNSVGCWAFEGTVLFGFDRYDIRPEAYPLLDDVVSILERNPDMEVEVQGHTDSIGDAAYNQGLSEKRAKAIMDYLASHGIASYRLSAKGYGETLPIASNETEEGRAKNRRVQLRRIR
jgi:OOP family OmpA-OmpF porin